MSVISYLLMCKRLTLSECALSTFKLPRASKITRKSKKKKINKQKVKTEENKCKTFSYIG